MAADSSDDHGGHELGDDDTAEDEIPPDGDDSTEGLVEDVEAADDLVELIPADPTDVVAATKRQHVQKFRWWALGVIAGLCVFFALATLLVGALASGEAAGRISSDMAKTAIPTLLTLLGTAVAWAFKSEKD
ncbi:hypothetical protein EB72_06935 [Mycobacterium sp. SWH-M1]|nr:hypothetical protein EB72_06935 [Mycobacterium sp. SWH-M1]